TRVLARRGTDRIQFIVGRRQFEQPPPKALLPRSSSRAEGVLQSGAPSHTNASAAGTNALLGSWRTAGATLALRADGTFARVSNSGFGQCGGVIGVDDNGRFDVQADRILFHGSLRDRTCTYSFNAQNELVLCDVPYHRP